MFVEVLDQGGPVVKGLDSGSTADKGFGDCDRHGRCLDDVDTAGVGCSVFFRIRNCVMFFV